MKKYFFYISILTILFVFTGCTDDKNDFVQLFGAAFESPSINLSETIDEITISLLFNIPANENGEITIGFTTENADYSSDFSTTPEINENNKIVLPFAVGETQTSFIFTKLVDALPGESKVVIFIIEEIIHTNSQISGNTTTQISFNETASLGNTLNPNVGGPNQSNSVFIDLSTETESEISRDSWDLGFYSGENFRVMLNSTIAMAAAELDFTDIDEVSESDVIDLLPLVQVSTFDGTNIPFFDSADGSIEGTVIAEISSNPNENKVYLVNLGFALSNEVPEPGSSNIAGDPRGWKKIRVLQDGENYVLQYANLNDTTHSEITISKTEGFNFTFYSFNTNNEVMVEPEKDNWDLNFTTISDEFFMNDGTSAGFIFFSDMVTLNTKNNITGYIVEETTISYNNFSISDVNNASFDSNQMIIGRSWRGGIPGGPFVYDDRYYILKDIEGNIYKIKFNSLLNDLGERGYPEFQYSLLD
jgi:hypothetical protein